MILEFSFLINLAAVAHSSLPTAELCWGHETTTTSELFQFLYQSCQWHTWEVYGKSPVDLILEPRAKFAHQSDQCINIKTKRVSALSLLISDNSAKAMVPKRNDNVSCDYLVILTTVIMASRSRCQWNIRNSSVCSLTSLTLNVYTLKSQQKCEYPRPSEDSRHRLCNEHKAKFEM